MIGDPTPLALVGLVLMTLLVLVFSGLAVTYAMRRDRLPYATRYDDIRERVAALTAEEAEKREEIRRLDQMVTERDQLVAEVSALEERKDYLQAELANLDEARKEIEDVRLEASKVAAEYAEEKQRLDAIADEYDSKRAELDQMEGRAERAEQRVQELDEKRTALQGDYDRLEGDVSALREQFAEARRLIDRAQSIEAEEAAARERLEALRSESERIETALDARRDEREALAAELRDLKSAAEQARSFANQAKDFEEKAAQAEARATSARDDADKAEEHLAQTSRRLEDSQHQHDELEGLVKGLREKRNELEEVLPALEARKALLDKELGREIGTAPDEPEALLGDLKRMPACLAAPGVLRKAAKTEVDALSDVSRYLKAQGLSYSDRVVRGFHTALKVNDKAQIVVLAGVSGTGKSLLPRRYCEAMGVHFLQIPVEPRWDSPQDLLGFYNYIEKQYRATELARLLVHMDPLDVSQFEEATHAGHMALVLLDEMNLARVEYYFSEFLSRLEVRPEYYPSLTREKVRDSLINVDVKGLKDDIKLFPSHNVLFAGTMNDDESTQALSDKVLDRGNVMQFAAPSRFERVKATGTADVNDEALRFAQWRDWVVREDAMDDPARRKAEDVIGKLAGVMEGVGRPFGHRLRDAIMSYCANYPRPESGSSDIRRPLADQVEYRIMPKLRGVDLEGGAQHINDLSAVLRNELDERAFADRLDDLVERQRDGAGLFAWRGLTRSE